MYACTSILQVISQTYHYRIGLVIKCRVFSSIYEIYRHFINVCQREYLMFWIGVLTYVLKGAFNNEQSKLALCPKYMYPVIHVHFFLLVSSAVRHVDYDCTPYPIFWKDFKSGKMCRIAILPVCYDMYGCWVISSYSTRTVPLNSLAIV